MKKKIAAALAVTFALGVTSAFAANPFVDVPAKHWAYDAVSKLAQAGIVDGYGDGTFRGDKNITRYEMAQIVAKALAKEDKANAEQKALLNKLSAEFSDELDNLGVRVSKLEKNASSIKITGDARIRGFENGATDTNGKLTGSHDYFEQRVRLYLDSELNKNVTFNGRISAQNKSNSETEPAGKDTFGVDYGYFTFKDAIGGANLSIGRQPLTLGYGLVSNPIGGYDAVKVAFGGDKVKALVGYGDISHRTGASGSVAKENGAAGAGIEVTTANITYSPSKNFQAIGSVYYSNTNKYDYEVYALGAKAQLNKNFALTAEYATNEASNIGPDDHAINAQLAYKGANKAVPKTFGVFVNYKKYGASALDYTLTSVPVFEGINDAFTRDNGVKGLGYGFNYTFSKNVIGTVTYEDLESYDGSKDRAGFGYARAEFWF
ncbi:S-layer family protein [Anaerospora hongkongensis]|uniref:S-layer family protein n=1 Tax=Anaerospora hongkongensis TaxID=244830 RepID=A0A4V2Q7D4_9FIRM|nr:S-layer homology domain-containing protein [Anaerospora hongkongensis]TCL31413.1 S-layer family protein [Anaerospora hongkongensis]